MSTSPDYRSRAVKSLAAMADTSNYVKLLKFLTENQGFAEPVYAFSDGSGDSLGTFEGKSCPTENRI